MDRIEKSGFRAGEYVGYSDSGAWRIKRGGRGWEAYKQAGAGYLTARTLRDLNKSLAGPAAL